MSPEAAQLLADAVEGNGEVHYSRVLGTPGAIVSTGNKEMITGESTPRDVAIWVGAVEELEALGCIEVGRPGGALYRVTRVGFDVAETLRSGDMAEVRRIGF